MSSIYDPLTLKQKIKFFRSYKSFVKYFPVASVNRELDKLKPGDLVKELQLPHTDWKGSAMLSDKPTHMGDAIESIGTKQTYYTYYKGEWQRTALVICSCYRVPSNYQNLPQGKMLLSLLREVRPFLQSFGMACYEINGHENSLNEFYLELGTKAEGHGSLYVPYEAFLAGDIDAIEKRNKDYLGWYTKKKDVWNALKETATAKCFFENMLAWEGK